MNLQEYKRCLDEINPEDLKKLSELVKTARKIILLGNGGSNAICSHIAQDYTKMLGKRALSFSDTSRMSCYANDFGWENAYTQFIKDFADYDCLIVLISSSGNSKNILNAAEYCLDAPLNIITLSGFEPDNKLRVEHAPHSMLHFYVNSKDYGIVECLHELILHSVI